MTSLRTCPCVVMLCALVTLAAVPACATSDDDPAVVDDHGDDIDEHGGDIGEHGGDSGAPGIIAAPAPLWVDDDGVQASAAGITGAYKTITAALAAASTGSVINVLPGVYKEKVTIKKSNLTLRAMIDRDQVVNPTNSPDNTTWPVIVESTTGNAIEAFGPDNLTIRGFYIRKSTFNGIHMSMGGSPYKFRDLCENIYILGNRIENVPEDGIKVNQCNRMYIAGNRIHKFSTIKSTELEHGIDFVAVANSIVRNNKILEGGTGITTKGGSINVLVEGNQFVGPLRWVSISSGEPSGEQFMYASSRKRYQAKYITLRNNALTPSGAVLWSCQSCSAVGNTGGGIALTERSPEATLNVCVSGSALKPHKIAAAQVSTSNCKTVWPSGIKQLISTDNYDVHGDGPPGGFPADPAALGDLAGKTFTIMAEHSGKCIDVTGSSTANGAALLQSTCTGLANQAWTFKAAAGGTYTMTSKSSGKCLDLWKAALTNGATLVQWTCSGGANQRVSVQHGSDGSVGLRFVHSGKCLDVAYASTTNGGVLQQWGCYAATNQRFRLTLH
jgi:hypothetical protein